MAYLLKPVDHRQLRSAIEVAQARFEELEGLRVDSPPFFVLGPDRSRPQPPGLLSESCLYRPAGPWRSGR